MDAKLRETTLAVEDKAQVEIPMPGIVWVEHGYGVLHFRFTSRIALRSDSPHLNRITGHSTVFVASRIRNAIIRAHSRGMRADRASRVSSRYAATGMAWRCMAHSMQACSPVRISVMGR